jgi:hypothetical protein
MGSGKTNPTRVLRIWDFRESGFRLTLKQPQKANTRLPEPDCKRLSMAAKAVKKHPQTPPKTGPAEPPNSNPIGKP